MRHVTNEAKSKRLQALYKVLKDHKYHTTAEIQGKTGSVAVHTDISDLRSNDHDIICDYGHTTDEGRKVYKYRLEG